MTHVPPPAAQPGVPSHVALTAVRARAPWLAASIAMGGLAVVAAADAASGVLEVASYERSLEALRTTGVAPAIGLFELITVGVAGLNLLAIVAAGVAFICWLYQARTNLGTLASWELDHGPGWAIGGWFIPFLNLVIPYKVVAEVAKVSGWLAYGQPEYGAPRRRGGAPVGWWWAALLISNLVGVVAAMRGAIIKETDLTYADLLANRTEQYTLLALSGALTLAAAALAILVVHRITRTQSIAVDAAATAQFAAGGVPAAHGPQF
jgi:hypothetical protein